MVIWSFPDRQLRFRPSPIFQKMADIFNQLFVLYYSILATKTITIA